MGVSQHMKKCASTLFCAANRIRSPRHKKRLRPCSIGNVHRGWGLHPFLRGVGGGGGRERTALIKRCATILQMFLRLGGRTVLRTYIEMGLWGPKSPPNNAELHIQSTHSFSTSPPSKPQHQPYPHVKPNYGAKEQYATPSDDSTPLDKAGKKFIQKVCGVFLFLARGVDGGLLPALSSLASQQANLTERTMELCKQFLD